MEQTADFDDILARVAAKKAQLDRLRPLKPGALDALRKYYDVELTYTSNAIEGNTLTHGETAQLIEHGITVGGKKIGDHLEALDHYEAVQWMREQAKRDTTIGEDAVTELHRRIILRSQPEIAGVYRTTPCRIVGSAAILPNPAKLSRLMGEFGEWLEAAPLTPASAFEAHFKLVAIHPFADGNGRTARLMMNMMLIRGGFPPVAVRPEDRNRYIDSLEYAHTHENDLRPFQTVMHERLDATLGEYVTALEESLPPRSGAAATTPKGGFTP